MRVSLCGAAPRRTHEGIYYTPSPGMLSRRSTPTFPQKSYEAGLTQVHIKIHQWMVFDSNGMRHTTASHPLRTSQPPNWDNAISPRPQKAATVPGEPHTLHEVITQFKVGRVSFEQCPAPPPLAHRRDGCKQYPPLATLLLG